ncbi:hypothetical protein [Peribacillus frigoritolerans]|uniref:hypothetical protein n=1 Tax=Peribacillus frigoritolerans TaxID=450367 RepID=UPI00399F8E5F
MIGILNGDISQIAAQGNAPNTFEITENFVDGDNEQDGEYERININRYEVVNQLGKIISMSEHFSKRHLLSLLFGHINCFTILFNSLII